MSVKRILTDNDYQTIEKMIAEGGTQKMAAAAVGMAYSTYHLHKTQDERLVECVRRGLAEASKISTVPLIERVRQGDMAAIRHFEATRLGITQDMHITLKPDTAPQLPSNEELKTLTFDELTGVYIEAVKQ